MKNLLFVVLVAITALTTQAQSFNYNKNLKSKLEKQIKGNKAAMSQLKSWSSKEKSFYTNRLAMFYAMTTKDQIKTLERGVGCLANQNHINKSEQNMIENMASNPVLSKKYLNGLKDGKYSTEFAGFLIPYLSDMYSEEHYGSKQSMDLEFKVLCGKWGKFWGSVAGALAGAAAGTLAGLNPAGTIAGAILGGTLGGNLGDAATGFKANPDGSDCTQPKGFPVF